MSGKLGVDPYCFNCEHTDKWIEIFIVDEHNQPFDNIPGTLTDHIGNKHGVFLNAKPILLTTLGAGFVTIELNNPDWLKQAQQRTPYEGEDSPIEQALKAPGHNNVMRQLLDANIGDFVTLGEGQVLPEGHQAGKNRPKLATAHSYIVRIKGMRLLTLRLGMFFDGTANNSYSAQWGKPKLDNYYRIWREGYRQSIAEAKGFDVNNVEVSTDGSYSVETLPESVFSFPDGVDGSAANELTNVQKLYERYELAGKFFNGAFIERIYITGVGTDNSTEIAHADESVLFGEGLGTGDYGVIAKAKWAIDEICRNLEKYVAAATNNGKFDAIGSIEFDVFGFSRGSAAARHFINLVLEGAEGAFARALTKASHSQKMGFINGFDWDSNDQLVIRFAGLFDTVAAIVAFDHADFTPTNNNNGDVKLWLDPKRVERAVHLTAHPKTEYRKNFCLNRLNPAPNFEEYQLVGCHSDIGGGYHAAASFSNLDRRIKASRDYRLPRFERQLVAIAEHSEPSPSWAEDKVKKQLEQERQALLKSGWPDNFTTEIDVIDFDRGPAKANGRLYLQRIVEGDLSRLYLRLMYGLAKYHGVPVDDEGGAVWERDKYLVISDTLPNNKFAGICESALKSACIGDISALQCSDDDDKLIKWFMAHNLVHHSAEINNVANGPHRYSKGAYEGQYRRVTFECHKE